MITEDTNSRPDPNPLIVKTLRTGVGISFALLLSGLIWTVGLAVAAGKTDAPTIRDPVDGSIHWHVVLLTAGILVLMATPITRLLAALWFFARAGERRYAGMASAVLIIVLATVGLALGHLLGR